VCPALLGADIDVVLGSDSLLTGEGTLLDELAVARAFLSGPRLLDAVGPLAARRLEMASPSLAPGSPADLVLLRRPLLDCRMDDVLLVAVDGQLRTLDPELVPLLGVEHGQIVTWRGVRRWISGQRPVL
jgi:hypothetical protein